MKQSTDRILTTHVGSLPRVQTVVDFLFAQDQGASYDHGGFDETMRAAVGDVVRRQVEVGVDVVSDGEVSKISYATYIRHRLTGFEIGEMPRATPKDLDDFPDYKERLAKSKFATWEGYGVHAKGHIALQDHGDDVWFRNIKVREVR